MPLARAIALNIIKSFVPLNLPGSAIIHYLQELNVAYRRTDMLADIRKAFDRIKYETQVTALRPDQVVPESWMNREDLAAPFNYRYSLKVTYRNLETGEYTTEHRYMFDDENLQTGDVADKFPDYAIETGSPPDFEFQSAQVTGVTRNMRAGVVPF